MPAAVDMVNGEQPPPSIAVIQRMGVEVRGCSGARIRGWKLPALSVPEMIRYSSAHLGVEWGERYRVWPRGRATEIERCELALSAIPELIPGRSSLVRPRQTQVCGCAHTADYRKGEGGRLVGSLTLLTAGTGAYSSILANLVGQDFASVAELLDEVASASGGQKVRLILNANMLRVAGPLPAS